VGFAPEPPPALRGIESLPRRFVVMPPDVAQVKQYILDHAGH
jgi:threonine synthase